MSTIKTIVVKTDGPWTEQEMRGGVLDDIYAVIDPQQCFVEPITLGENMMLSTRTPS